MPLTENMRSVDGRLKSDEDILAMLPTTTRRMAAENEPIPKGLYATEYSIMLRANSSAQIRRPINKNSDSYLVFVSSFVETCSPDAYASRRCSRFLFLIARQDTHFSVVTNRSQLRIKTLGQDTRSMIPKKKIMTKHGPQR